MGFLYQLGVKLYYFALLLASPFHPKARQWIAGRKGWEKSLRKAVEKNKGEEAWIWFHAASLGEFEQGRNLIEAIKTQYPHYRILLSFFSPSGYEVRKNYQFADHVTYLPVDTVQNAKKFLDILNPTLIFFIKYELWLNFLAEVRNRKISAILVSASVDRRSKFLTSPLAPQYKKAFGSFAAIFTQDTETVDLLGNFTGHPTIISSSDTRYDRVFANKQEFLALPEISTFKGGRFCLMGGSVWPPGEALLFEVFESLKDKDICMILAPHEIEQGRIQQYVDRYPDISLRYSEKEKMNATHRILWIDNIGMLSRLYHYADVAYIGGGFRGKLHNVLEAVAFGCPVFWGPKDENRPEAALLKDSGGGWSIETGDEMVEQMKPWMKTQSDLLDIHAANQRFVEERKGATDQILSWCESKGLLQIPTSN
ncbi:3-deoxy-D-manno-octulosonic acid transferase [bacterium]|nr:3-deoxy-D-manno-octulosonic acid transferase [bacterium]